MAAKVTAAGRKALLIKADMSKIAEIEAMVAQTVRELGPPDILVKQRRRLSACAAPGNEGERLGLRARHQPQGPGCFGCIAAAKALIAARKPGGSFINLASAAVRGAVRGVHYSASKGGIVSMTRALALELAPYNIRVNAIAPSLTDTAQPRFGNTTEELVEMAKATMPLGGKMLTPEQIAHTAVFLASDDSDATTGQVLHVNGGSYMP